MKKDDMENIQKQMLFLFSILFTLIAAATSTGILDITLCRTAEASQFCLKCLGCGKEFPLGGDAPGRCPACGFLKVVGKSGDTVVTDWARRVRCEAGQQVPAGGPGTGTPVDSARGTSRLNVNKATDTLNALAANQPRGYCAKHVQRALEASGISGEGHPPKAKDYGRYLASKGFFRLQGSDYQPKKGDLVVIQPASGKSGPGHIAMYDGKQWISDYRQKTFWGSGRQPPPGSCEFYRP